MRLTRYLGIILVALASCAYPPRLAQPASQAAADAPIVETGPNEVFKRFYAYDDDSRVAANGGLTPGTYATTAEDAEQVATGTEAISRYALGDQIPANKVLTVAPPAGTRVRRGIVQPANGQVGGGIEVLFVDGTAAHTVTGPVIIPWN